MHDQPRRYMRPMNEHALFSLGAAAWRTDIQTYKALEDVVASASWKMPAGYKPSPGDIVVEKPIAELQPEQIAAARSALQAMLNDPSLAPNLRMLGLMRVEGIELQNGALDHNWHHDGLAGKRHGHAGDFFCITYFSEKSWDDGWGGHFEYGTRPLAGDWPTTGFEPEGEIYKIAPQARTTLLGWNQNPLLVHRSAPLTEVRDRITMIASVTLAQR